MAPHTWQENDVPGVLSALHRGDMGLPLVGRVERGHEVTGWNVRVHGLSRELLSGDRSWGSLRAYRYRMASNEDAASEVSTDALSGAGQDSTVLRVGSAVRLTSQALCGG